MNKILFLIINKTKIDLLIKRYAYGLQFHVENAVFVVVLNADIFGLYNVKLCPHTPA